MRKEAARCEVASFILGALAEADRSAPCHSNAPGEGFMERPDGSFVRNLTLPKGVDSDQIKADYHDGVLELHIPKPAEIKPKKIAISSGSRKQLEK